MARALLELDLLPAKQNQSYISKVEVGMTVGRQLIGVFYTDSVFKVSVVEGERYRTAVDSNYVNFKLVSQVPKITS